MPLFIFGGRRRVSELQDYVLAQQRCLHLVCLYVCLLILPGSKHVIFHREKFSPSTVSCVFLSASERKHSALSVTQTSGQKAPNEWSRDPAEASPIKDLFSITHYLHGAAASGEQEKHD